MGTRLKERTGAMPKGFVPVAGVPVVEQSVRKLFAAGIEEIIIGTGHCADWYERLAARYAGITLAHNPHYARTGSMETLACCASAVKRSGSGGVILLESDIIYDAHGLTALRNDPHENAVLASGATHGGDEVYLEQDGAGFLTGCSKDPGALTRIAGELTGISRVSKATLDAMVACARDSANPALDYETVLARVSASGPRRVFVRVIARYLWQEIDDESHLARAEALAPAIAESESLLKIRREVLLNPGPATTTDSVKYAQVVPDICPREKEFGAVMAWITAELSRMAGGDRENGGEIETVLFGGSGTAADEVMISSCVPDTGKLLVIDNGAYGARMAKIAEVYRLNFEVFRSSGFLPLDTEAVKAKLLEGRFTHLAVVYHETTTGLLNPVPELGRLCREHGITTIVDGVSAFAAIPIDMDRDGIDFMASTSNKNIQGMPGAAFVFCRSAALKAVKDYPMRNYYLNLWDQYRHFKNTMQTRFTPPVQTLYALRQAIMEAKRETVAGRYARYSACWDVLVRAVKELGLEMLVPEAAQSKLITAVIEPSNPAYDFEVFHDTARARGFTIYPGKLAGANTFRIANIGDIQVPEMERFTRVLAAYITGLAHA
jgi:2-aminoethylphosphonate-pyruvate transaminase